MRFVATTWKRTATFCSNPFKNIPEKGECRLRSKRGNTQLFSFGKVDWPNTNPSRQNKVREKLWRTSFCLPFTEKKVSSQCLLLVPHDCSLLIPNIYCVGHSFIAQMSLLLFDDDKNDDVFSCFLYSLAELAYKEECYICYSLYYYSWIYIDSLIHIQAHIDTSKIIAIK